MFKQKNILYKVNDNSLIKFEEEHTECKEIVNVDFDFKERQYGIYANEYRSPNTTKEGCKTTDVKQRMQSHMATESLPGSHSWELGCTPEIRLRLDAHTHTSSGSGHPEARELCRLQLPRSENSHQQKQTLGTRNSNESWA